MRFILRGHVNDDGTGNYQFEVPDGTTVFRKEAAQFALAVLTWCMTAPDARVLTKSEAAAEKLARTLPDGWTATLDGVSTHVQFETGGQTFSRTYRFGPEDGDGKTVTAPCAADGSPIPATRDALLAAMGFEPVPTEQPAEA